MDRRLMVSKPLAFDALERERGVFLVFDAERRAVAHRKSNSVRRDNQGENAPLRE
jgi:hypothetical protein